MSRTFPTLLSHLRQSHGLSMTALAKKIGVSEAYISFLESGRRHPSRKISLKLAQLLAFDAETYRSLMEAAGYNADLPEREIEQKVSENLPFSQFVERVSELVRDGRFESAQELINQGLRKYQNPVQIQLLVAHLALARQEFSTAISAMESAVHLCEVVGDGAVDKAEILMNMGIAWFQKGSLEFQAWQANHAQPKSEKFAMACRNSLQTAQGHFESAIALAESASVYLQDEYARLIFNLAELDTYTDLTADWALVLDLYQKLWLHSERAFLKTEQQQEMLCFLALSYAKNGQFQHAQELLETLQLLAKNYPLSYYALACFWILKFEQTPDQSFLKAAEQQLDKLFDLAPHYREQAEQDPALVALFKS